MITCSILLPLYCLGFFLVVKITPKKTVMECFEEAWQDEFKKIKNMPQNGMA